VAVHLHGNDGSRDQHRFPTDKNVGDYEGVRRLLTLDVPVIVEANSFELLERIGSSRKEALSEASETFRAVRKKGLPPG
jgi:hypothetical protein